MARALCCPSASLGCSLSRSKTSGGGGAAGTAEVHPGNLEHLLTEIHCCCCEAKEVIEHGAGLQVPDPEHL